MASDTNTPALASIAGGVESLGLRPREAAKALGISERTLWTMTNCGEVPHTKIGRCTIYPVGLLREWLAHRAGGAR